jgi:hypothetical protein
MIYRQCRPAGGGREERVASRRMDSRERERERERGRGACMILEPMEKRVKLVRG